MALIKCKECGKEISENAISCPNCGNIIKVKEKIKSKSKKAGATVVLIASSIFVMFFMLLQIAELTPTQKNPEYSERDIEINVKVEENEYIINKNLQAIINIVLWGSPIMLTILSILHLTKNIPSKKIYGMVSLILSILWLFMIVVYISKESCCNTIFIVNPITSLIGSIITLVELLGEKK